MLYNQTMLAFEVSQFLTFKVDIPFYAEYSTLYLIAASTFRCVGEICRWHEKH